MDTVAKKAYEALFLVDSGLAASDWDGINAAVKRVFDRAGAEIVSQRKWDERRLAYQVNKNKRGTYILVYFNCDPLKIAGIEKDVNLSEEIIRAMILRGDYLTEQEMQKDTPWMMIEKDPELAAARRKAEMDAEARDRQVSYVEEEPVVRNYESEDVPEMTDEVEQEQQN